MRKFNEREKEIIKKLSLITFSETEFFSFFLQTKYFTKDNNKALFIIPKQNKALLYVNKENFDNINSRKKELGEFLELISLIIYLKENRYINIYPNDEILNSELLIMKDSFNSTSNVIPNIIKLNVDGDYIDTNNFSFIYNNNNNVIYQAIDVDSNVYDLIKNNFFGLLYVSEELIQLSNNNFISEEESRFKTQLLEDEVKFKKQRCDTWVSIGLSFIVGALALIYQVYTEKSQEKETQKVVDTQNEYLKKISSYLDSINIKTKLIQEQKKDVSKDKK
jgi:hypothetical protein